MTSNAANIFSIHFPVLCSFGPYPPAHQNNIELPHITLLSFMFHVKHCMSAEIDKIRQPVSGLPEYVPRETFKIFCFTAAFWKAYPPFWDIFSALP